MESNRCAERVSECLADGFRAPPGKREKRKRRVDL